MHQRVDEFIKANPTFTEIADKIEVMVNGKLTIDEAYTLVDLIEGARHERHDTAGGSAAEPTYTAADLATAAAGSATID